MNFYKINGQVVGWFTSLLSNIATYKQISDFTINKNQFLINCKNGDKYEFKFNKIIDE